MPPISDSVYVMGNPNPAFFGGEPIWNTAEKQGVRTASFYWSVVNIRYRDAGLPSGNRSIRMFLFSDRADSVIAWLQLPEEVRPHLIMWYMEEPDGVGHRATPDSSATLSTVEHLDRILGDFFAEARRLDIFDQIDLSSCLIMAWQLIIRRIM